MNDLNVHEVNRILNSCSDISSDENIDFNVNNDNNVALNKYYRHASEVRPVSGYTCTGDVSVKQVTSDG